MVPEEQMEKLEEVENVLGGGTRRRRIPHKRTSKRGGKKSKRGGKKSKRRGKKTRRMRMRGGIVGEGVLSDLVQRRDALKTQFEESPDVYKNKRAEVTNYYTGDCMLTGDADECTDELGEFINKECSKEEWTKFTDEDTKNNCAKILVEKGDMILGTSSSEVGGGRRKKSKRGGKKKSKKTRRMRK